MRTIIAAVISVICAVSLLFVYRTADKSTEAIASEIYQQLEHRVSIMTAMMNGNDSIESEVVSIWYKLSGQPLKWSSNEFIPNIREIEIGPPWTLYSSSNGDFLVFKRLKDEKFHLLMLPLRRTYQLSSEYEQVRYNSHIFPENVSISNDDNAQPIRHKGGVLFRIAIDQEKVLNQATKNIAGVVFSILILSVLLCLYDLGSRCVMRYSRLAGVLFVVFCCVLLRLILDINLVREFITQLHLFNPDLFHFKWFYPTLGDGMINALLIDLSLVFILLNIRQSQLKVEWLRGLVTFIAMMLTYLALYALGDTIYVIGLGSNLNLDITDSLAMDVNRLAVLILIALLAIAFFVIHNISYQILSRDGHDSKRWTVLNALALILVASLLYETKLVWYVIPINLLYLIITFFFRLPETLASLKFQSVNYLMLTSIVLASVVALSVYKSVERRELHKMQRFIGSLQVDRDIEGEFILSDLLKEVGRDRLFAVFFKNKTRVEKWTETRLEKYYFNRYFSNYDVTVQLYDSLGNPIFNEMNPSYQDEQAAFGEEKFNTAYHNIRYDGEISGKKRKRYICFVDLYQNKGKMKIEMSIKKFSSKRVLPRLIASQRMIEKGDYNYAFIADGAFNFTSGDYEYLSKFDMKWLGETALYKMGIERDGYHHLGVEFGGKLTLVSQKVYDNQNVLSNFSFYFILIFAVLCLVGFLWVKWQREQQISLSFSTKIMLYSTISFILPLLLVAVAVLTTTDHSNRNEIDKSNLKRTLLLAENLDDPLTAYADNQIGDLRLEDYINQLAAYSGMDINLYDKLGVLLASSTPEIFDKGILSKCLHPQAMKELIASDHETMTLNESVSSYQYKTSYVRINSPRTGELMGVLASPYFAIKNHVMRQQLQVFGNIINIFTLVFIFSIGVAYWVIAKLTEPIVRVAGKLHETGFVNDNQPIEWTSDDEIGVLVREYNNMLAKLEETKIELAQNEKEAAWREMAKQVAHEIKNPLTPMKLTIQHLSRMLDELPDRKKAVETLLTQIDTLDEIVTSFSHFAKMPTPVNEPFDFGIVLQRAVDLHVDKRIDLEMPSGRCIVNADKKLFGRIFNNLILNGFQAMKTVDSPMMVIRMYRESDYVIVHFNDHGEGIDPSYADKVFTPNFSTKDSGSGIGLAVARRGIEHAGGKIWFESEPGETTFMIKMLLWDK